MTENRWTINQRNQSWPKTMLLGLFFCMCIAAPLFSVVPDRISYQGKLLDSNNAPIVGNVDITFTIYDHETLTSGHVLWTETYSGGNQITLTNGHFSVDLGSISSLSESVFSTSTVYLGVKVGSDAEMTPRVRLLTVPYAFRAQTAQSLNSVNANNYVRADIDANFNANVFVSSGKLAVGTTAPSAQLDVKKLADANAYFTGLKIDMDNTLVGDGRVIQGVDVHVRDTGPDWGAHSLTGIKSVIEAADNTGVTLYGLYSSASGAENNYALYGIGDGYFSGDLTIGGQMTLGSQMSVDGDLTVLGNALKVDKDGQKVGIRTVSPDTPLHVAGGSDATLSSGTGFVVLGPVTNANLVLDTNEIQARNAGAKSGLHIQPEGGDLTIHANQGAATKFIIKDDGLVGVGTTVPSYRIDFGDTASPLLGSQSKLALYSQSGTGTFFYGFGLTGPNGGEGLGIWGGTEASVPYDGSSGAHAHLFVKRNTGFVGIGTTTPARLLDVQGDMSVQDVYMTGALDVSGNIVQQNDDRWLVDDGNYGSFLKNTTLNINSWIFQEAAANWGIFYGNDNSQMPAIWPSNGATFITRDGASGVAIPLNGLSGADSNTYAAIGFDHIDGNAFFAGSVGIGKSVASQKLDVAGTVKATAFDGSGAAITNLNMGNAASGTLAIAYGGTGATTTLNALVALGAVAKTGDTVSGTLTMNGADIFYSNPTTLMRSDTNASGVPGLDGFRIQVSNDFFGSNLDALVFEKTDANDADPDGGIAFINTGASESSGSVALVIRGDGKVGLGKTAPAKELDVSGNIQLSGDSRQILFSGTDGRIGVTTGTFYINPDTNTGTHINSGSSGDVVFEGSGKVKVGPASMTATEKVQFDGNLRLRKSSGNRYLTFRHDSEASEQLAYALGRNDSDEIFLNGKAGLAFATNEPPVERVRISGNGYLGVGVSNPSSLIHVVGPNGVDDNLPDGVHLGRGAGGDYTIQLVTNGGTPKIDFINDNASDYDARLALVSDNSLQLLGADLTVVGALSAASFSGNGAAISNLNADNISSGSLPVAQGGTGVTSSAAIPAALGVVSKSGDTMTGALIIDNAETAFRVATNNFVVDGARIGVGTASPTEELELTGAGDTLIKISSTHGGTHSALMGVNDEDPGLYFSGDGATNFDHDAHLVIRSDGDVGIGLTGPAAKLHIDGGIGATPELLLEDETQSSLILRTTLSGERYAYMQFEQVGGDFEIGHRSDLGFYLNPNKAVGAAGAAMVIQENGNVGIGITNPAHTLEVQGDIYASGIIEVSGNIVQLGDSSWIIDNGSYGAFLKNTDSALNSWLFQEAAADWGIFYGNNNAQMAAVWPGSDGATFITRGGASGVAIPLDGLTGADTNTYASIGFDHVNGNAFFAGSVGIGKSIASQMLDVAGTVKATAFEGSGAAVTQLNMDNVATGSLAIANGGTGATTALGAAAQLSLVSTLASANTMAGTLTITPVDGLSVGTTQLVLNSGSVGIGTATPSSRLDVSGGVNVSDWVTANAFVGDGSRLSNLQFGQLSGIVGVANGGTGASTEEQARTNLGIGSLGAKNAINSDSDFDTNFRVPKKNGGLDNDLTDPTGIANARNVLGLKALAILDGIGPDEWTGSELTVDKGGTGATTALGAASQLNFVSTLAGSYTMAGSLVITPLNGLSVGTTQLVLSGGNLGVGTNSPSSGLEVVDNAGTAYAASIQNANADGYGLYINVSHDGDTDKPLLNIENPSSKFYVRSDGAVGLGTTTPARHLDVQGDMTVSGIYMPGGFPADGNYVGTSGNFLSFGHVGASEDFIGYSSNTFYFKDAVGGSDVTDPDVVVGGRLSVGNAPISGAMNVSGDIYHIGDGRWLIHDGSYASFLKNSVTNINSWIFQEGVPAWGMMYGNTNTEMAGVWPGTGGATFFTRGGAQGVAIPLSGLTGADASAYATIALDHEFGNAFFAGSVGIGKSNPSQKLDVEGTIKATAFDGSGAAITNLNMGNVSTGTLAIANGGTGGTTAETARTALGIGALGVKNTIDSDSDFDTNYRIAKKNGGLDNDLTDPTGIANARQALGLKALAILDGVGPDEWTGSELPVDKGGTGATTALGAASQLKFVSTLSGANTMAGTLAISSLDGFSVGTTQLAMSGGQVGVGTNSPSEMLEVAGNLKLKGSGVSLIMDGDTPSFDAAIRVRDESGSGEKAFSITTRGTGGGADTERFGMTGAEDFGDVYVTNANFGIGQTRPVAPIDISNSGTGQGWNGWNWMMRFNNDNGGNAIVDVGANFLLGFHKFTRTIYFGDMADLPHLGYMLTLHGGATTEGGYIGINTLAPKAPLHVAAESDSGSSILMTDSGPYGTQMVQDTGTVDALRFNSILKSNTTVAESNLLVLERLGDVGFGVAEPSTRVHMKGKNATDMVLFLEPGEWDSSGDYAELRFGDSTHYIRGEHTEGLTYHDGNKHYFSGGAIGIHTTDVSKAKFTVGGFSSGSQTTAVFGTHSPVTLIQDGPYLAFNQYYSSGFKAFSTGYSGRLGLDMSNGELHYFSGSSVASEATPTEFKRFFIANDGRVGLNSSSGFGTASSNADVHIGAQEAAATTAGTVSRLSIQPYGHTDGPFFIDARDTVGSAYLDLRYGGSGISDGLSFEFSGSYLGMGLGYESPITGVAGHETRLAVNGAVGIGGSNVIDFGFDVAGKQADAGKIGYGTFVADQLNIVGAGNAVGTRKVYVLADGGLTLVGPLTGDNVITGTLFNSGNGNYELYGTDKDLVAGTGLTGGGDNTLYGLDSDLTINHQDYGGAANSGNTGGTVITNLTFDGDGLGHVTGIGTTDLDLRYMMAVFDQTYTWTGVADTEDQAVSGTWSGTATHWGFPRIGSNGVAGNEGASVDFLIPDDMKTVYFSYNAHPGGGYIDVYARNTGTTEWVFAKRVGTFDEDDSNQSNNFSGNAVEVAFTGVYDGVTKLYDQIRFVGTKGEIRLSGVGFTREDHRGASGTGFADLGQVKSRVPTDTLGIGTTNPIYKLDFGDGGAILGDEHKLAVYNQAGTGHHFYGIGTAGPVSSEGLGLWGGTEGAIPYNGSSGVQPHVFVQRNTGNVGIGTTSPGSLLEVAGKLYSTGAAAELSFQDRTNSSQFSWYADNGVAHLRSVYNVFSVTPHDDVASAILTPRYFDSSGDSATLYLGDTSHFITTLYGEGLKLSSGGSINLDNFVGIGTSTPAAGLDIYHWASGGWNSWRKALNFSNTQAGIFHPNGNTMMGFHESGIVYWGDTGAAAGSYDEYMMSLDRNGGLPAILNVNGKIQSGVPSINGTPMAALEVSSSGASPNGAVVAIRQTTAEGNTRIFGDYGPWVGYGIFHDNGQNAIHFTRQDGASVMDSWQERDHVDGTLRPVNSVTKIDLDNHWLAHDGVMTIYNGNGQETIFNYGDTNENYIRGTNTYFNTKVYADVDDFHVRWRDSNDSNNTLGDLGTYGGGGEMTLYAGDGQDGTVRTFIRALGDSQFAQDLTVGFYSNHAGDNTSGAKLFLGDTAENTDTMFLERWRVVNDQSSMRMVIGDDGNDSVDVGYYFASNWFSRHLLETDGDLISHGAHTGTAFFDKDDTAFYADPANVSRLYTMDVIRSSGGTWYEFPDIYATDGNMSLGLNGGSIHFNGSVRGDGGTNALRVDTGNGWIDIGAINTSWAHFHTDRAAYWFDKGITTEAGVFNSYQTNMLLQRDGSTEMEITDGSTEHYQEVHFNSGADIRIISNRIENYGGTLYLNWAAGADGSVTVGNDFQSNPINEQFEVGGSMDVYGTVYHQGLVDISDQRLKKNVARITNPLDKIMALEGVSFEWDREATPSANSMEEGIKLGFVAQEVEKVVPDIVSTREEYFEDQKYVAYTSIIPILVEAMKEHKIARDEEFDTIVKKIALIEEENKRIATLESELAETKDTLAQVLTILETQGVSVPQHSVAMPEKPDHMDQETESHASWLAAFMVSLKAWFN